MLASDRRFRRLVRRALIVVATSVVTLAAGLLLTMHAATAKPGEWSIPMRFGLLGARSGVEMRVGARIAASTETATAGPATT